MASRPPSRAAIQRTRDAPPLGLAASSLLSATGRPLAVVTLGLGIAAAQMMLHIPTRRLVVSLLGDDHVAGNPWVAQVLLLAVAALLAALLLASVCGVTLAAVVQNTQAAGFSSGIRAVAAQSTAGLLATAGALVPTALLGLAVTAATGAVQLPPAAASMVISALILLTTTMASVCAGAGLLALAIVARRAKTYDLLGPTAGVIAFGEAMAAILRRPWRAMTLLGAAMMVTLPLTMMAWFALALPGAVRSGPALVVFEILQSLCAAAVVLCTGLTLLRGLIPEDRTAPDRLSVHPPTGIAQWGETP